MKETDQAVSESLWDAVLEGQYDTTMGLRPDGVWHDEEYWYVSYSADPAGRWIGWNTRVERYTGGEQ